MFMKIAAARMLMENIGGPRFIEIATWGPRFMQIAAEPPQQAHDVENTLAFNCVSVATSENVMATSNRRQTPTSYLSQIFDVELRLLIEWKWKFF